MMSTIGMHGNHFKVYADGHLDELKVTQRYDSVVGVSKGRSTIRNRTDPPSECSGGSSGRYLALGNQGATKWGPRSNYRRLPFIGAHPTCRSQKSSTACVQPNSNRAFRSLLDTSAKLAVLCGFCFRGPDSDCWKMVVPARQARSWADGPRGQGRTTSLRYKLRSEGAGGWRACGPHEKWGTARARSGAKGPENLPYHQAGPSSRGRLDGFGTRWAVGTRRGTYIFVHRMQYTKSNTIYIIFFY